MTNPVGESTGEALRLDFDRRQIHRRRSGLITSDAGPLARRPRQLHRMPAMKVVDQWSPTSPRGKPSETGAKVACPGHRVRFHLVEIAMPQMFQEVPPLVAWVPPVPA